MALKAYHLVPECFAQELLGGLWAYVRLEAVDEEETLAMLTGACPQLAPLLPTAVAMLAMVQQAAGHVQVGHGA